MLLVRKLKTAGFRLTSKYEYIVHQQPMCLRCTTMHIY